MDFSEFRMTDLQWFDHYRNLLGYETLFKFINQVYGFLMSMPKGSVFDIKTSSMVTDKNRELFIKTACLFITEGNPDYCFSNNYTEIKRI